MPRNGLLLPQRHADEVDLGLDEVVGVVGALRAAEDHGAGMLGHRGGQRVAEARAADVEGVAAIPEGVADAPGVDCSWCRTIRIGGSAGAVMATKQAPQYLSIPRISSPSEQPP